MVNSWYGESRQKGTQMKLETSISTGCNGCEYYDEDTDTYTEADSCQGYCYEDAVEDYTENLLKPWLEAKAIMADSPVRIHGSGMTWLRRSGHADTSARAILDTLAIDGDFTIKAVYEDGELSFVRYSHDEPTGASFTVEPISLDGETEWA